MNVDKIISAIYAVTGREGEFIPLHIPEFIGNEKKYISECIDSNFVSSIGAFVDRFEKALVDFTGVKHAVLCVNGTAALHTCLNLTGVMHGDEVLIPSLTFVATANAVSYAGAVPHFVDSDEKTLGIDPQKLADYLKDIASIRNGQCHNRITGARIRAIIPVHIFGHPVDMDAINDISDRYRIAVVEDAAESLGSYYKGRHTGNFGKVAALSFNGNKIITTGGGGAVLTNDSALAAKAKHMTTTAKVPHRWAFSHDMIGYNYRMPALNAAMGCAQLEMLPGFLENKRALAEKYQKAFADCEGFRFFTEPSFARSNYWLNAIMLKENNPEQRDKILEATNDRKIMTRPAWTLLHKLPMFANCRRMGLETAESVEGRVVNIPSSAYLGQG